MEKVQLYSGSQFLCAELISLAQVVLYYLINV